MNNYYVWIVNVYLNGGTMEQFQELFSEMKNSIPESEWDIICCLGDFNIDLTRDSNERKLLGKLCKLMGLKILMPNQPTRQGSLLDFSIVGKNIETINHTVVCGPSDHKAVNWELGIKKVKKKTIKIPCRITANEISLELLNNGKVKDATAFLHKFGKLKQKKERKIWKVIKPKSFKSDSLLKILMNLKDPNNLETIINDYCYWIDFWVGTENTRYSVDSANAYNTLRRILKYHLFEKRDGGIINCIKKEDDTIKQSLREN